MTLDSLTLSRTDPTWNSPSLGDLRPGFDSPPPAVRQALLPSWILVADLKVQCENRERLRTREQTPQFGVVDLSEQLCQARIAEGDDGSGDEEKKTPSRIAEI